MSPLNISSLLVIAAAVGSISSAVRSADAPISTYLERTLELPKLDAGEPCPVSVGDNQVVSSRHTYIFGAGGYFFGTGPVYLALSWKPRDRAEAFFSLDRVPLIPEGYRLKTPWIMKPEYQGEALVRGAQIGVETRHKILFRETTQVQGVTETMVLRAGVRGTLISESQAGAVDALWGFWPSSMILPEAGCYAIQIDTEDKSDIIVIEAILPSGAEK